MQICKSCNRTGPQHSPSQGTGTGQIQPQLVEAAGVHPAEGMKTERILERPRPKDYSIRERLAQFHAIANWEWFHWL